MIKWPEGQRDSDGIWSKIWYKNVHLSTHFENYQNKKIRIENKYIRIYEECKKIYDELNEYNLLNE